MMTFLSFFYDYDYDAVDDSILYTDHDHEYDNWMDG